MQEIGRSGIVKLPLCGALPEQGQYRYELILCTEGQCVCSFPDTCVRLLPEQLLLCRSAMQTAPPAALTGRESGIRLLLRPERMELPFLAEEQMDTILSRLCAEAPCVLLSSERAAGVLRELMHSDDPALLSLKTAELFLILREIPEESHLRLSTCTAPELAVSLEVFRRAMQEPGEHLTVAVLAEQVGVSPTRLKESFRHVYGAPVYTLIRSEKMRRAAQELLLSDCRVSDAASRFGYDNCSKFSKAFAEVMGMTPTVYRRVVRLEH